MRIACFLFFLFASETAFSAGIMHNVSQDIDISRSTITTYGDTNQEKGVLKYGIPQKKKNNGLKIGKIENDGGQVNSVKQKINMKNSRLVYDK